MPNEGDNSASQESQEKGEHTVAVEKGENSVSLEKEPDECVQCPVVTTEGAGDGSQKVVSTADENFNLYDKALFC